MDSFTVALASGFALKEVRFIDGLKIGAAFGFFQFLMPLLGWFAGLSMKNLIACFDHWVAFGLLGLIGGKMIYEGIFGKKEREKKETLDFFSLLMLSLATSIDALAVGLSFSFLNIPILRPALVIGIVTFGISFAGVLMGTVFGRFLGKKMEIAGGVILLIIGFKILIEHLA